MNFWYRTITIIFGFFTIGMIISCSDDDKTATPVLQNITAQLYENGAYSVKIIIIHDGSNRDLYCGFLTEGDSINTAEAVQQYISSHEKSDLVSSANTQKKHILSINGLTPEKTYTYTVFGVTSDGQLQGNPVSVTFTTRKSDVVFTLTDKWEITYSGQTDYNNFTYSKIIVVVNDTVSERYYFFAVRVSELDTGNLSSFLSKQVDDYINNNNAESDEDYFLGEEHFGVAVKSTIFYQYMAPGEYLAFAVGINADGTPTGHYSMCNKFCVDEYTLKTEYATLLNNTWNVTDATGKMFNVKFQKYYTNSWVKMYGWGGWNDAPILVRYSMDTEELSIKRQLISDIDNFYSSVDDCTYEGEMYFNGWYYTTENTLKLVSLYQSEYTLAKATVQTDGSYIFNRGFNVSLDSAGTKASTYGMTLQFHETSSGSNMYFTKSTMQFPITMKIAEER